MVEVDERGEEWQSFEICLNQLAQRSDGVPCLEVVRVLKIHESVIEWFGEVLGEEREVSQSALRERKEDNVESEEMACVSSCDY